jgi:hypothetical protein
MRTLLQLGILATLAMILVGCGPSQADKDLTAGFAALRVKDEHTNSCLRLKIEARKAGYKGHALVVYLEDHDCGGVK